MLGDRWILVLLALSSRVLASPISVTINGNFGAPAGASTVFDNQNYLITFAIADPHSPTNSTDAPGGIGQVSATYRVPARLSVPGLGLSVNNNVDINYNRQQPLGIWLNIFSFTGLPTGDFLALTPFQTLSGAPLWNGLAGSLGTPEIAVLNAEPSSARWFLEQNTNMGPIPIAVYGNGTAAITTAAVVPEPSTISLLAAGLLAIIYPLTNRARR